MTGKVVCLLAILCLVGCAEFAAAVQGGKEAAVQAADEALETTAVVLESGQETAKTAAGGAETPVGMIGNWFVYLLLCGASAVAAFLKRKLDASRSAGALMASKIEARTADNATAAEVKASVARAMIGATESTRAELQRAIT